MQWALLALLPQADAARPRCSLLGSPKAVELRRKGSQEAGHDPLGLRTRHKGELHSLMITAQDRLQRALHTQHAPSCVAIAAFDAAEGLPYSCL